MPRVLVSLLAAVFAASALAQTAHAADLDAAARSTAVAKAAELLRDRYVSPEAGAKLADRITAALAAGDYASANTTDALADDLNRDIRSISSDVHLKAFTRPEAADPTPQSEGGIARVDMLAGDIGYIDLVGFPPGAISRPAEERAMRLIAGSRALIIDLRRNRGGDAASVAFMESFFLDPSRPVHLSDVVMRIAGSTAFKTTPIDTSPTPISYLNRPVLVITGPRTISGAEAFAYDLQAQKRVVVIGSATAGGANPGAAAPLIPGLNLFVPTGRTRNPVTGTSWEGEGVRPDTQASPDYAMATAVAAADRMLGLPPASPKSDPADFTDEAPWVKTELMRPQIGQHPGTQAALKRLLEGLAKGRPDYGAMTPEMAETVRAQLAGLQTMMANVGSPGQLRFVENDPVGQDIYEVVFAHGLARWSISLDAGGKIALAGLDAPQ